MLYGEMTDREIEVINQLLAEHDIIEYEIVYPMNEGKPLPGSTYPGEIEEISGWIVTATNVYLFWLDWFEGHYTLGEHRGFWEEVPLDEIRADKEMVIEAQQRLQKKRASQT